MRYVLTVLALVLGVSFLAQSYPNDGTQTTASTTANYDSVIFCGELANAGTVYGGPAQDRMDGTGGDYSNGSTNCLALDDATEATADAPILTPRHPDLTFTGMFCMVGAAITGDTTFTLRSEEADLSPTLTCTAAGAGPIQHCTATGGTASVVNGQIPMAVQATTVTNELGDDWWCKVYFTLQDV